MNQPDRDACVEVAVWPQAASGSISSNDVLSRIMLVLFLQPTHDGLRPSPQNRINPETEEQKVAAAQLVPATRLH